MRKIWRTWATSVLVVLSVVATTLAWSAAPASAAPKIPPAFERAISGRGYPGVYAWGMTYNPVSDEILVGDYFNYWIRRYDRDGTLLGSFYRPPSERKGQPYSLAVDPRDGDIYVPEISDGTDPGTIAKYDKFGNFMFAFDTGASYNAWITVDANGYLYVADSHYWHNSSNPPKIRKYSVSDSGRSASHVNSFGTYGSSAGRIGNVHGLAVDSAGNIYGADQQNRRVTVWTNSGSYVRDFGSEGEGVGQFRGDLRGVALSPSGSHIYVVDAEAGQVEQFTTGGTAVRNFGSTGNGSGQFADGGRDIAVTPDGHVWVADYGNFSFLEFTATGVPITRHPDPRQAPQAEGLSQVRGVAVASDGSVWAADTWNHRFTHFAADGSLLATYGRRNSKAPYGMNYPRGIGVDPATGNIWVANTREHNIRVYGPDVSHLFTIGGPDSSDTGNFRWPHDFEFYGGQVVVGDYVSGKVKFLDPATGAELRHISRSHHGVAVDPATGRIFVVDDGNDRVYAYNWNLDYLGSFGSRGSGYGQMRSPWDAVVADGRLYVTDPAGSKVIVWDTNGNLLGEFGSQGDGPGEFSGLAGIAADPATDKLYVADSNNSRIQVFDYEGTVVDDGTAPSGTISLPVRDSAVERSVVFEGTAQDPSGVAVVEIAIKNLDTGRWWDGNRMVWEDGARYTNVAVAGPRTDVTWRYVFHGAVPDGSYSANIKVTDVAGNRNSGVADTTRFTTPDGPVDAADPEVTLIWPQPLDTTDQNPIAITGEATDDLAVDRVELAIKDRVSGNWWDEATGTWGGYVLNPITVDTPGEPSSTWTYLFDHLASGGSGDYWMTVRAVDEAGRVDGSPSTARFGYDPGGGGSGPEIPETTLTSPTYDQVFTSSPVTASGTASADVAIATVQVAVKDRTTNEWYDAATDTWHAGFRWNDAALGVPGATSTSWSLEMPLAPGGYHLQARAIDTEGDIDPTRETARFDVTAGAPDTVAPDTSLDTPYEDEVLAPNPTLDGAAADAVGVTRVDVAIKDRDSGLWYDTSAGTWSAGFRWNVASLASPGATATTWSLATALGVGDYHVQARAVDAAGNVDASRASLRFSVADVATFTDWIELFDLPDGTTSDTGDTAWTLSAGGGTASVQSGAVTLSNTGGEAVWRSEVLDISAGPVSIAIDWEGAGPMETSADYFRAYYRIDGGAEVEIASRPGPFSFETISAAGLTGSTLEIVVRQYNTFDDEIHRLHRVAVTAG